MKTLTMIGYGFKQVFRYRANWFFLFLFPMLLIFVLGAAFGGGYVPKVGVSAEGSGPIGEALVARLERVDGIEITRIQDADAMRRDVERGRLEAGVVVPRGFDDLIETGDTARLTFIAQPAAMQLRTTIAAAVAAEDAVLRAARLAQEEGTTSFDAALAVAEEAALADPGIEVTVETVGAATFPETLGRFDVGASSELILFVFLMSMMGGIGLIEARRLGVIRRILSTPTSARSVLFGQGISRLGISLVQALVIMLGSALLFDVRWGDPVAAALLLVAFALVGTGAAMLLGATLRTEQQAVATSLLLGLSLGALGGAMVPIEFFSDVMRTVAHLTPHAWALDGFAEVVRHDAGVADVLTEVGVLLAFAALLLGVGSWRLRRVITR